MTQADLQYNELVKKIIASGYSDEDQSVRTVWNSDGSPAHTLSLVDAKFHFDNSELPILTTKKIAWKTAIKELLWIWQKKSNTVKDLKDMNVSIWDQWELPDGTIGKAYGYQLGKKCRALPLLREPNITQQNGIDSKTPFYKTVDQVDYLIHELVNNPSSRRHITTLWNINDIDDMALTPCVYETQWYVKERKIHLTVRARSNDMALTY